MRRRIQQYGGKLRRRGLRGIILLSVCLSWVMWPGIGAESASRERAQEPAIQPDVLNVQHGQPDDTILAVMPALDLPTIMAAESPTELPRLVFTSVLADAPASADPPAAIEAVVPDRALPVTLLLASGDWFDTKLRRAATTMGLHLTPAQFDTLEAMAVSRSVNTRLLVTIARLKQAPTKYQTPEAWLKWLFLETTRIRASLGPFDEANPPTIRFRDGQAALMRPAATNAPSWALTTILGAGNTGAETARALDDFYITYAQTFGDPARTEAQQPAATPFLYKPYRGSLTGRGYYDHTYPSVDNGGTPNVAGMRDYLGRSNVNYDTHDGDDLWMPYGSEVYAPVSGSILWHDSQGVLIGYEGNSYHIYIGHLSQRNVSTGANVSRGQLIGRSGRAGGADHIHLEVRHNGKQLDTMGWYGGGSDPCPGGPAPSARYLGCEPSTWLWADEPPPSNSDTTSPWGTLTAPPDGMVTPNRAFTLTADASDNAGGSGVNRVEFHARYDDDWHALCTDQTAPYSCTWDASSVRGTSITFTIHVVDNAGNRVMDPGGYRTVRLDNPLSAPTNLRVSRTTADSATLSWDDRSNSEEGYNLYIGIETQTGWVFVLLERLPANTTGITDRPLSCEARYAYQVSTYRGATESTRAGPAVAVTGPCEQGGLVPYSYLPWVMRR